MEDCVRGGVGHHGHQFTNASCPCDGHQEDPLHGDMGERACCKGFEGRLCEGKENKIKVPGRCGVEYWGYIFSRPLQKPTVVGGAKTEIPSTEGRKALSATRWTCLELVMGEV